MRVRRPLGTLISGAALAVVVAMFGMTACTSDSSSPADPEIVVRKDVKDLTDKEKAEFVGAIKEMRATPASADGRVTNLYDSFVAKHLSKLLCWTYDSTQGGWGHDGPDLITWHRAFLLDFEEALADVAGHPIAIPYWDWTNEESTAAVFVDDFMGPPGVEEHGYAVMSGPFRKGEWVLGVRGVSGDAAALPDYIVRAVATNPDASELPDAEQVTQALLRESYDAAPWTSAADPNISFRQFIDGGDATGLECQNGQIGFTGVKPGSLRMHSTVHLWVGGNVDGVWGSLANTATSPNDPVFWLHHANIDRIAEAWWSTHEYEYLPVSGGPNGNNIDDLMHPYEYTNGDMAVSSKSLGYIYDSLPSVSGEGIVQTVLHEGSTPGYHH